MRNRTMVTFLCAYIHWKTHKRIQFHLHCSLHIFNVSYGLVIFEFVKSFQEYLGKTNIIIHILYEKFRPIFTKRLKWRQMRNILLTKWEKLELALLTCAKGKEINRNQENWFKQVMHGFGHQMVCTFMLSISVIVFVLS